MKVMDVRNVNEAIDNLRQSVLNSMTGPLSDEHWELRQSRNGPVFELSEPVATVYDNPWERVSFSKARDANPFFHFFESLWIIAGRSDVEFLSLFNKKIGTYSDDGATFHAPYGKRLRKHWREEGFPIGDPKEAPYIDQLDVVAKMLKNDPDTRRAVLTIWDVQRDLGIVSLDIPCNDMVFFKARRGLDSDPNVWSLDMTVCCRSNDAIWGAYGANAVQFSVIQELVASAADMEIGRYTQISDSLHIYTDNEAWQRIVTSHDWNCDPYPSGKVRAYPLINESSLMGWIFQAERLCIDILMSPTIEDSDYKDSFFRKVALPMWKAWWTYKNTSVSAAVDYLETQDLSIDWLAAGMAWMLRRVRT